MKHYIVIITLGLISNFLHAKEGKRCQLIEYKDGYSHTLYSSKENGLYIQFPEIIVDAPNPNSELWKDHAIGNTNHFWIRPDHDSKHMTTVGLTAIGQSGSAYSFIIENKSDAVNCAIIKRDFGYGKTNANLKSYDPVYSELESKISKINDLVNMNKQAKLSVKNKVNKLTSPYVFKSKIIHSVLDDGRFTKVTLKNVNPGDSAFVISASIDGVEYPVDYDFDDKTLTYEISGLFDEIYLIRGKEKIIIKRTS